jgi:hypothetical protein
MPRPHALQKTIRRHAPQRNQNGDGGRQQKHGEGKGGAEIQPRQHNNSKILAGIAKDGRILRALRVVVKRRGNSAVVSGCSQRCGVNGAHEERDENSRDIDNYLQSNFFDLPPCLGRAAGSARVKSADAENSRSQKRDKHDDERAALANGAVACKFEAVRHCVCGRSDVNPDDASGLVYVKNARRKLGKIWIRECCG